jgi:ribosomal protein L12E/L44/L45/RPP1/RPP2
MNLQDMSVLLAAIDVAVKRGVFSVLEVGQVSEVAVKLNNFLVEAQKAQEAAAAAQAEAGATTEATAETTEATAETTEAETTEATVETTDQTV